MELDPGIADRRQILVVDDDEDIRNTLRLILEEEGYGVAVSPNGTAALGRMRDGAIPELILLDLMMPEMDGWALLRACADDRTLGRIPVVVITASTVVVPPAGAVAILRKPIQLDLLLATIDRNALERSNR